jgi:hypothetical protein
MLLYQITVLRWQFAADEPDESYQGRYAIKQKKLEKSAYT